MTTAIDLPDPLAVRLAALASETGIAPGALFVQAVADLLDRADGIKRFEAGRRAFAAKAEARSLAR